MRIIAGSAGGIRLEVPDKGARPTTDRVREAVFSILGERVVGARVLDLFAGSGSLGIEALSRGAERACFVEENRKACGKIRSNLEKARLSQSSNIAQREVSSYLAGTVSGGFNLVFADPPYWKRSGETDFASELMSDENLLRVISPEGMVVLETARGHVKNVPAEGWELLDTRSYGDTEVSFFLPEAAPSQ